MKTISICDRTVKQLSKTRDYSLTFREKIEVAKLLDKLGVDVIELDEIRSSKVDTLLIKSIVTAVENSCIAVPVSLGCEADEVVNALKETKKFRLQVEAPMSSVQMEYICGKKPAKVKEAVLATIKSCLKFTDEVEFVALDATRGDMEFMADILKSVIELGVKYVTLSDDSGTMLPYEFGKFIKKIKAEIPEIKNISYGVNCADELKMADACAVAGFALGISEIKCASFPVNVAALPNVARIIKEKGKEFSVTTNVNTSKMNHVVAVIERLCAANEADKSALDATETEIDLDGNINSNEDKEAILKVALKLGYDLSDDDAEKVYKDFKTIAAKKEVVSLREFDAIIAANAMQVPPVYKIEQYIANTSLDSSSMVHVKLDVNGEIKEGISLGDGPIDAALHAIEQITGRHFELDGFGIRAVTEGKEATGEAVVKLRNNGKLYPGRGLSTDIIGASIKAYINALNKIVYEEEA